MPSDVYAQRIARWERSLAQQDPNRTVQPFQWGLEWLGRSDSTSDPAAQLKNYVRSALQDSEKFFAYERPRDFALAGSHLTFTTPLVSPYPENNTVHADFFPAGRDRTRAVVLLPQWNADASGHVSLCRVLSRCGLSALRMSLAYHDRRMPAGHQRAECHVSSNIGRTIHASRQSVIDARACLDWLQQQGYQRLGILGTSLGSCIAFIVATHDARVSAGVFNHVSMYFGDVVWTGLATRHVREGLGDAVTQDELREYWSVISPATYVPRLAGRDLRSLLIWAKHDTSFLPEYSRQFIAAMRAGGHHHEVACLPCAHYTIGRFPFNLMDAFLMCRFLRRHL